MTIGMTPDPSGRTAWCGGGDSHSPAPSRYSRTLEKTEGGGLPAPLGGTVWAGRGMDRSCNGCDEKILSTEIEFEVDALGTATLRFHAECHKAWLTLLRQ
jgi:hypothetical protein